MLSFILAVNVFTDDFLMVYMKTEKIEHVLFNHIEKSELKDNSVEELNKMCAWFSFLLKWLSMMWYKLPLIYWK